MRVSNLSMVISSCNMDKEVLQSQIITVLLSKGGSVSVTEFAGLFHQIHGYQLKLANYGYTSLKKMLEDMKDIQLIQINGEQFMRWQVVEQTVAFYNSCKEKDLNNSQLCRQSRPTSGPSSANLSMVISSCNMDKEVLQSQIITVLLSKGGSVSVTEFAGLFHQIHGYHLKLANYGYTSLKKMLEDMKDIQLIQINGEQFMRWQVVEQTVAFYNSCKEKDLNNSQLCRQSRPTSGPSSGLPKSSQKDHKQVVCKSATEKKLGHQTPPKNMGCSSKSSKPAASLDTSSNLSPLAKKPNTATSLICASRSGTSTSCDPSTRPKSVGSAVPSSKLNSMGPCTRPRPVPTQSNSINNCSTKANIESAKSKTAALYNNTCLNTAVRNTVSKINVNSKGAGTVTSNTQPTRGHSQEITNLPNNSCFNTINNNQKVNQVVHPTMSYSEACRNNINNKNRQTCVTNSRSSYTPIPSGTQYRSSPEPNNVWPSSAVKNNIQSLLTLHVNGLSIFQLQKMYLFKFHEPLARKGFPSIKHLLLGMKDMVKLQGVGVQMLVFPVTAEDVPANAAERNLDKADSLNANADSKNNAVISTQFLSHCKMVASSSLLRSAPELKKTLTQNHHTLKDIKQLVGPSKAMQDLYPLYQDQACNSHFVERPREDILVPPKNVLHSPSDAHHMKPPSLQTPQQMHRSPSIPEARNDVHMASTDTGPEQIDPKSSNLPQFILHSSGFSIVMNKTNVPHDIEGSKNISHVPTAVIKSSLNDSSQATSDINNSRAAPLPLVQHTAIDTHSKMLKQPKICLEKQQMSYTNTINQNTELLLPPLLQPVREPCFAMTEQPKTPLTGSQLQTDDIQDRSIHEQMEYQSLQPQINKTNTQNAIVLKSSGSSEPQTQNVRQDFHTENALQPKGSTETQLQDKVFNLHTLHNLHKVSKLQTFSVLEQNISTQSQQEVTNCQSQDEAKQSKSSQPQVKVGHFQTNVVIQPIPQSTDSKQAQKPINSQDRNEHRLTECVLSQPQDKVIGSQTQKVSGQTETRSSLTKQKKKTLFPDAHPPEKGPNSLNNNSLISPTLHLKQKELVFQNKNLSGHTSAQSQKEKSQSSQQKKDFQHICPPEETMASPTTITSSGKILSIPLTPRFHECTNESRANRPYQQILDSQVNIPGQHVRSVVDSVPQNSFKSSSEEEGMKTWQTNEEQPCCIL